MSKLAEKLIGHARLVMAILMLVTLLSAAYAYNNAQINSDLGALIKPSDSLRWYRDNEVFKQQFPMFEQTALVVISGEQAVSVARSADRLSRALELDPTFTDVFAPGVMEFISDRRWYFLSLEELKSWLLGVEYSYGPMLRLADEAGLSNFIFTLSDHMGSNRGLPLPAPLQTLVTGLIDSNLVISGAPVLVDPDATEHFEIILVRGRQALDEQLPNAKIVARLREHIENFDAPPNIKVRLTGEIPLAHEEILAALNGIEIAGLISLVLLGIILGFGIRSLGFVISIFVLLSVGVILTLALAVLVVGSFNTLSLIFLVMFFGLGVDFAVHFGLRLREAAHQRPYAEALQEAYRDTGPALALCMLTSSIAFLSFTPTAYIGLGELGIISALGMLVALGLTLILLPILLSKVGHQPAMVSGIRYQPLARPSRVLLVFALTSAGALWIAKDLEFDYSVLAMRDSGTEGMQTLLQLQDAGVSTDYSISVLAKDKEEALKLHEQLTALPTVANVLGPDQLIPADQEAKQALVQAQLQRFETIEEVFEAESHEAEMLLASLEYLQENMPHATLEVAAELTQLEQVLMSLSDTEITQIDGDLYQEINRSLQVLKRQLAASPFKEQDIPSSLMSRFVTDEGARLLRVQPSSDLANRDATTHFIQEVSSVAPNIAGRSVIEWGMGDVVAASFVQASLTALAAIFVVLIIFFRSLLLAILVLVPIVVSLVMTFAICEMVGLSLNMANILVVPLIIGLGVDTGIHVVHRMTRVGADGLAATSTARAVIISALTTIGTFFSLSFSPHLGAASIGLLLTVAISLLVMVTFVLLPALMQFLKLDKQTRGM